MKYWAMVHDGDGYTATPHENTSPSPGSFEYSINPYGRIDPGADPVAGEALRFTRASCPDHAARLLRAHHPGARAVFQWRGSWLWVM